MRNYDVTSWSPEQVLATLRALGRKFREEAKEGAWGGLVGRAQKIQDARMRLTGNFDRVIRDFTDAHPDIVKEEALT